MPIYLKLGDIRGDVQDARYKGWIQLESVNLGNAKTPPAGTSRTLQGDVQVTVLRGQVSVKLVQLAGQAKVFPEAVIVLDHGDAGTITITMNEVMISSFQFGGHGNPVDSFTLSPFSISYEHGPAPESGKTGPGFQVKKKPSGGGSRNGGSGGAEWRD